MIINGGLFPLLVCFFLKQESRYANGKGELKKIKDFFDSNGSRAKLQEFVITIDITSTH